MIYCTLLSLLSFRLFSPYLPLTSLPPPPPPPLGCMRVYRGDNDMKVRIYTFIDTTSLNNTTDSNIKQFAECHFKLSPGEVISTYIDSVIDSSRYFVLRIKDPNSSKVAFIGIGFRERDTAVDFRECLNEYLRLVAYAW